MSYYVEHAGYLKTIVKHLCCSYCASISECKNDDCKFNVERLWFSLDDHNNYDSSECNSEFTSDIENAAELNFLIQYCSNNVYLFLLMYCYCLS